MYGETFFFQAFIYLAAAVVSVPLAKRLGLGSVLGYLIAGVAIGPFGFGLVGREGQDVMHFAEFGVVMMLFLVGLELQPALLWRLRGPILGLGGLQVGVSAVVLGTIAALAGLGLRAGLGVGMILALSSTAIVLQTLSEKGLMGTSAGQSSFAVLLFQDLAVIPMLALMPLLAGAGAGREAPDAAATHAGGWIAELPAWGRTLVVLGAVALVILGGRFLVRPAFRFIARTRLREIFTAAGLLLVVGIALLMSAVGLSPALGTFLAGVLLATSEYRHELESDIEPFKGLLLGLFFIAVGASIDFALVAARPGLVAGLVAGLLAIKFAILLALARGFRMGLEQSLLFAFALAQGGEFAFVLFSFATQTGLLEASAASPLVAVVALSMAATPLLMLGHEKLVQPRVMTREREARPADAIDEQNAVIVAGFGRFGHIVGRLLTANGVGCTVLDVDSDHVELLRKLGLKVFYGDASRHDLLEAAGAARARLLVVAVDGREKRLEIIRTAQKHFPNLEILTRARNRDEAYELLEAGVQHVWRDTLDSSLALGVEALRRLGFRAHRAVRAARTFRVHDEASVRELSRMRHDRKAYLVRARQTIEDLERLMREDRVELPAERDLAWDTTSLRAEIARAEDAGS